MKHYPHGAVRNCALTLVLLLSISLLTSCAPTLKQISTFGTATDLLAEHAAKGFVLHDQISVDRRLYLVASNPANTPTDNDFEGIFSDDAIATRVAVLKGLATYSKGLKKLAEANYDEEIDEAAGDLSKSLTSMSTYPGISASPDLGIIASGMGGLLKGITAAKKKKHLSTIISNNNPVIQEIVALLADEFKSDGSVIESTDTSFETLKTIAGESYKDHKILSFSSTESRFAHLKIYEKWINDRKNFKVLALATHDTILKVGVAHQALADATDFSAKNVISSVTELVSYAKSVKESYEKLSAAE